MGTSLFYHDKGIGTVYVLKFVIPLDEDFKEWKQCIKIGITSLLDINCRVNDIVVSYDAAFGYRPYVQILRSDSLTNYKSREKELLSFHGRMCKMKFEHKFSGSSEFLDLTDKELSELLEHYDSLVELVKQEESELCTSL